MRGTLVKACFALALFAVAAAGAQGKRESVGPSIGASIGFTADPGTFLLTLEAPFRVAPGITVGPLLQLGLSDDWTIVAPTANVRYAFDSVGPALVSTSLILVAGFSVLSLSSFLMNSAMGQLTAITIVIALVMDFVLLPALLIEVDGTRETESKTKEERDNEHALAHAG